MSPRFTCRILLLFALAAVVYSQGSSGGGGGGSSDPRPEVPESVTVPTTNGVVGTLLNALWPITDILLELVDSYLKNMYGVSLPCTLESITPFKGECTVLQNP